MPIKFTAIKMMDEEAQGLLTRLDGVKPFALHETMVPAAMPSLEAQVGIECLLTDGQRTLRNSIKQYRQWLASPRAQRTTVAQVQRRLTFLKLKFNAMLTQFDIFADVMTQRSEHETGVWLSGLDAVAADALALPGGYFQAPPVVCYLDRGYGAAIRRARTRLPGGSKNPVAVIRVPRERMVGGGIASSLVHEVGHQGAALLDLVNSLRSRLQEIQETTPGQRDIWQLWERWISEILADFWSIARVGVSSTQGLIGVVSLPRAFVFRVSLDDPHPIPWIRVKLSCAIGEKLYPDPQWRRLAEIWEAMYPLAGLDEQRQQLFRSLEAGIPAFVDLLVDHRPASLQGTPLWAAMAVGERQPDRLRSYFSAWQYDPRQISRAPPSLVFAVLGQARADDRLSAQVESSLLSRLLTRWALRSNLSTAVIEAARQRAPGVALAT